MVRSHFAQTGCSCPSRDTWPSCSSLEQISHALAGGWKWSSGRGGGWVTGWYGLVVQLAGRASAGVYW